MRIRLHDGRTVDNPTDADLERLLASLSDPGDFIILNDERRGEVRAAGPNSGTFLLQFDLPGDGRVLAGELPQVSFAEALSIFREFRAGRADFSSRFVRREQPESRGTTVFLLFAIAAAGGLLLWWFTRAA